jgi:hypothetical protein
MSLLHQVRKPCPHCGRPMKLVRDEAANGKESYVCPDGDDPLHDPAAQKWVDSPLRPPADSDPEEISPGGSRSAEAD